MNWFDAVATLVCAASMALFYFLMESRAKGPRRIPTADGREFQMPDMRFHYTPEVLYAAMEQAGEEGRPRMRRYWLLDYGFIASFLAVMLLVGLNVMGAQSPLLPWMAALAGARAALDAVENTLMLSLLKAFPTRQDGKAKLAGVATSAKFLCLYAWVALLFYRLATTAFGVQ